jgi:hypothetical protein
MPHLNSENLWWDRIAGSVYSFGGVTSYIYPNTPVAPLSLWTFTPDTKGSGTWNELYGPTDRIFTSLTRTVGSGFSYTPDAAFMLGGYESYWTSPQIFEDTFPVSGLVSFTFKDSSWSNISSAGYSAFGFAAWVEAQFVPPYGEAGLLLMVGGVVGSALRGMDSITIYDIYNQRWYGQTATGDIPAPRTQFCVVAAQGGDNSTYEM